MSVQPNTEIYPNNIGIWCDIKAEAKNVTDVAMRDIIQKYILDHETLEDAICAIIAYKLADPMLPAQILNEQCRNIVIRDTYRYDFNIAAQKDIWAVFNRDPACYRKIEPMLYFKGFQALQAYRIAHLMWKRGEKDSAYYIQSQSSKIFNVDIHPAAQIGKGIMLDHAHGVVIGETCVIEDDVSILQGVTLGGTGKELGDRHPKIGYGVLIGTGAKVLGNIKIGKCSRIAAGSVVIRDVPPNKTVAGVPAKIIGSAGCEEPATKMDHNFSPE